MSVSHDTNIAVETRGSLARRLYAFFAVALAVFLMTIAAVGFIWNGYAPPAEATALPIEPRPDPAETAQRLEKSATQLEVARRSSTEALENYEFTNAALVEFVNANLKQLQKLESEPTSASATAPTEEVQQATVNPRWKELHDELAKLETRRAEALVTLMPSHPTIRYIDLQLSDLQAQLKLIPEQTKAVAKAPAPIAAEPKPKAVLLEWRKVDAEYQNLRERQTAARKNYDEAIATETAARKKHDTAAERNLLAQAPPPKLAGTANPKTAIYVGILFATAIGCVVALRARANEAVFRSVAEVRQTLGLPILGCLPRAPGELPREQPLREPRWVKRTVLTAELSVAAVVAWIAIAGLTDHQFFYDLLANPLAACSQKFWC